MSGTYDDPWTQALRGQEPCHYGCGLPAAHPEVS